MNWNHDFLDPTSYNFPTPETDVTGGQWQTELVDKPDQHFEEDFDSDTGFTYDSDKAEFTGGQVQQKNQVPANATFGCNFASKDGNFGDGVLTGTLQGSATVSGGKLNCGNSNLDAVTYSCLGNADFVNEGALKVKVIPNYSGSPASNSIIFHFQAITGYEGEMYLRHNSSGGNLVLLIRDASGSFLVNNTMGSWSPTASQAYEFELNVDLITGATRLFIDGVQSGSTVTTTGNRAVCQTLWLGRQSSGSGIDASFEDLLVFDTVQHTSDYTPGYTVPDTKYAQSLVTLPEMEYTGIGVEKQLQSIATSESGTPKYRIQIGRSGDYLYHDGSAWTVVTDTNDYSQANDIATFAANISTLNVDSEMYDQMQIIFPDSNTVQSSVSSVDITYAGQEYPTGTLLLSPTSTIRTDSVSSIEFIGSANTSIIQEKDGMKYWYNASNTAWETSDGSPAQSNTQAELTEEILVAFTTDAVDYRWYMVIDSSSSSQEYVSSVSIAYSFAANLATYSYATIYGVWNKPDGTLATGDIQVSTGFFVGDIVETSGDFIDATIKGENEWEVNFKYETDHPPDQLTWLFGDQVKYTNFLEGNKKFSELTFY